MSFALCVGHDVILRWFMLCSEEQQLLEDYVVNSRNGKVLVCAVNLVTCHTSNH